MLLIDYCTVRELPYRLSQERYSDVDYIELTLAIQELLRPGTVSAQISAAASELAEVCFRDESVTDAVWNLCIIPFQRNNLTYHPHGIVRVVL